MSPVLFAGRAGAQFALARYRAKKGLDTNFDMNEELLDMLAQRLDLLEEKSSLDPDLVDDPEDRKSVDLPERADFADFSPNVTESARACTYILSTE